MRVRSQVWRSTLLLAATALLIPACGGGSSSSGGPAYTPPTPFLVALSAGGPDALYSAGPGPGGTFYAAGFAATGIATPRFVTVVKILATGALDLTFGGGDGIATTAVEFAGGTQEIGIAVQPTGKIVVSATVVNAANTDDRDVSVLRLNTDGSLDLTFAAGTGVRTLNLNDGTDATPNNGTAATAADAARGIAVDRTSGLIYLYAVQRGEGNIPGSNPLAPRTDVDFTVVRLTVDGDLDLSYAGGDGKFLLDLALANATPRGITVLANGSVIGGGYTNTGVVGWSTTVQPVIFKLTPAGVLDSLFAGGFFHETILTAQTEVYNFAVHGTHLVTAGYGRENADPNINVWISLRLDVTTGERDLNWGGAPNGAVTLAPSALSSNARFALALPGNKTVLVGSTGAGAARDAAFAVLAADGTLDPDYGAQAHVMPLGADGDDAFWGGAVSGTNAILVGLQVATGGATSDDAYALIFPLQ